MICSSRFLKRLSCRTFLMATISPVSTTAAWKTTPKEPLPMIRSAEYDMVCSPVPPDVPPVPVEAAPDAVELAAAGGDVGSGSGSGFGFAFVAAAAAVAFVFAFVGPAPALVPGGPRWCCRFWARASGLDDDEDDEAPASAEAACDEEPAGPPPPAPPPPDPDPDDPPGPSRSADAECFPVTCLRWWP